MSPIEVATRKLLTKIRHKLAWGEVEAWDNYDFDQLSKKIENITGVQLSAVTLKRVFGKVKYDSKPSTHTLNTLSQYLGHNDFRDFQSRTESKNDEKEVTENTDFEKLNNIKIVFLGVLGLLIIGILLKWLGTDKEPTYNKADFTFDHIKIGEDFPASVIFKYDASKAQKTSKIEIQQNWDERRRTEVSANDSIHNSLYYYPGYFEAKLVIDDEVIIEQDVFIPSNDWVTTIERKEVPIYVSQETSRVNDTIGIDSEFVKSQNIIPQSEEIWTNYCHVRKHDIFSDDFTLEASLKNTAVGGVNICQKIQTQILFEGGAILIPMSKVGCVADLNLYIPESEYNGKTDNLSMFGTKTENWNDLKVVSKEKSLSIYINDQEIKRLKFGMDRKRMVGFRFRFQGSGWLHDVKLNEQALL